MSPCPDDNGDPAALDDTGQFTSMNANGEHAVPVCQSQNRAVMNEEQFLVHVALPRVQNEEEYKFLPEHSRVHQILSQDSSQASYTVELKSGDIELVGLFFTSNLISKLADVETC